MEWEMNCESMAHVGDIAPDLKKHVQEFILSEVWARPGRDRKMRNLCNLAALTALDRGPQFENASAWSN